MAEDTNIKKLLWCLKALALKPTTEIPGAFMKVENFYKWFCASYDWLCGDFEDLFIKKLNFDYWNTSYMLQ